MKRQDDMISVSKMRVLIRILWYASAAAWLGIWIYSAVEHIAFNPLLWIVMALDMTLCVLLGRVYQAYARRSEEMDDLQETLRSAEMINRDLRARRHDVINHMQVVYSLLQLKEYEEALNYLEHVNRDFVAARSVLRTNHPAVNALLSAKKLQGEQKGLRMEYEIRTSLEELSIEPWEFCRILGNLLDNAIDAAGSAEEGYVKLDLMADLVGVHFSVSNNGETVLQENLERVFAAGFTTKGQRGTGMGLFIVRQLVEAAGGRIAVSSEKGETCFAGYIPAGQNPRP